MGNAVAEFPGWKRSLVRRKDGNPYPDERNVQIALDQAPELKDILQYDEFSDRIELRRPLPGMPRDDLDKFFGDDEPIAWADDHVTKLVVWLTTQGFVSLRESTVHNTVVSRAKDHAYHPVRDYLTQCRADWDGKPRLETWLKAYLGAKDHAAYLEAVGPKFLIGAVARIFEPGCQMDSILVLEGEQGKGKSTAVRILGADQWARDITGDLSSKDAAIGIQSVWIGEMAELTSLRRSDQEAVKGFISRRIDHYRPPYGRNSVDRPRHSVFIATTNENEYLQDATGARRFWPVDCAAINLTALKRDVAQLWGEGVSRYEAKEPWYLDDYQARRAGLEQASRARVSTLDIDVLQYADALVAGGVKRIEMRHLLAEVFDIGTRKDPGKSGGIAGPAARALVRDGWRREKPTGRGKSRVQAYVYIGEPPCEPDQGTSQGSQGSQGVSGEHEAAISEPDSQGHKVTRSKTSIPDEDIPF